MKKRKKFEGYCSSMCFVYHRLIGSLHLVYITESGGGSISQHFEYFCIFDFLCYAVKMLSFSIIISLA